MNNLKSEKSLYLKQHAENLVNWYPWDEAAFAAAKAQDKPIIVSVGYSSCHWCHVMAHESFEDEYIAKLMNEHFICIKVDREEHPEVDRYYMESVQMMNGQGGWPLNAFCLPDGRPFAGGTYFPPDESRGHQIVPWPQLLMRIADYYKKQKEDLIENAEAIEGNIKAGNAPLQATGDPVANEDLFDALKLILETRDKEFGGFGKAPKFPPAMPINFLHGMRSSATIELLNKDIALAIDETIEMTLTAMAHGGIYDQIGGGFSRYSVDQLWLIPHFEKMLYDNALLIESYSRAYQRYPKPIFAAVVTETIDWLHREMKSPQGPFYSAIDADNAEGEGDFYVWSVDEVEAVLGKDEGEKFCHAYGITPDGNFEDSGKSQAALLEANPKIREELNGARAKLLIARQQRPAPGIDQKLILSWNAIMIKALTQAAFTFDRAEWLEEARELGEWIWNSMRDEEGNLYALAYEDEPQGAATLEDYAYSAEAFLALAACIDWKFSKESQKWIDRAETLIDRIIKEFSDPEAVGYFSTNKSYPNPIPQKKEWFDNATPAANSSILHCFSLLSLLTENPTYATEKERLKIAYPGIVTRAPAAIAHALSAVVEEATGIAVIKVKNLPGGIEMLRSLLVKKPWRRIIILESKDENQPNGFQLCVGTQCLEPTTDAQAIADLL